MGERKPILTFSTEISLLILQFHFIIYKRNRRPSDLNGECK
jgi:hypothetical protein